ncbi:MAG: STAS domain-containing protein [Humidesulfovibrio sp.]|jgi:anti-sigma B factor antagonist|uniref:STAS domain-containing protein n=1 Tax=Humidesulfovibrio sp. TaxID=2910988 RepID=UPI0027361E54|nr:STAS domain-containing protein [Humidesulfovibrio sp.]MDP2849397.1 STAS domain-containing protein [Humidesulfovibrio sp.]
MQFTQNKEGVFLVLEVEGRMDAATSSQFEAHCLGCLEAGDKRLVVDLSKLEYISSAGLRSILSAAKKLKGAGGDMAFCAMGGIVAEVFAVSGFSKLFPTFPSRQEALARS